MKNEEQILLNYMYMNGRTDEEMHDPSVRKKVQMSWGFRMHLLKINFSGFASRIKEAFSHLAEMVQSTFDLLKERAALQVDPPKNRAYRRPSPQQRLQLRHQVMDRKPGLIRKIIK